MTEQEQQACIPGSRRLSLVGALTIERAAELKDALLVRLGEQAHLEIDLSKVTELDTAGVQLLLLAMQTAEAVGKELQLVEPSPAVREVFALLNLASHFGDPHATPSASEKPR
jgi:anti-sigma B factor antagonist